MWQIRREFTIRAPRLVGAIVFVLAGAGVLGVAAYLSADARRFDADAVEAAVVAARLVPATAQASTAYELTYQAVDGPGPGGTEAVPVAIWESASQSSRVRVKRLADGGMKVWNPASRTTIGVLTGVGLGLLVIALAIATAGPRIERAVSRTPFWTLFGSIWLTVGLPFVLLALSFAWQDWRLSSAGSTAQGLVMTKDVARSGSTGNEPTFRYSVRYRFEAAGGRTLEGKSDVPKAVWDGLVERQPVPIEHLPGSSLHRVAGVHERWTLAIFGGVGLFIGGAGALIVRADWRQRRRVKRLQESGIRAGARVTSIEPTRLRVNREPLWKITYEYQDRSLRTHRGGATVTEQEAARWKVGDTGTVLIDPASPTSTVWIGREEAGSSDPAERSA